MYSSARFCYTGKALLQYDASELLSRNRPPTIDEFRLAGRLELLILLHISKPNSSRKPDKKSFIMSDGEDDTKSQVSAAAEVEVSADETGSKGQMSVLEALKGVLKLALIHDGLARGLREASKALDRRQAHMCVLNEACEEEAYKKLVVALCSEHKIPLIKVPDGKQLGEWAGLCQIDREGNPRKVVNCSCVVVKDWGEESQERSILLNYFQTEQ
ncbi:40S ribosomal protein RPS12 [Parastagonospora nodorum]|nr:40S ribosomal protein RPS12 [Parastagonospora nodorum]KAH6038396.1 40S ribosomal protein RPS12 [Parastagonospora nodorum]KAH6212718.1 40S ribosomal protein RPS12 [Parastagonospora nodorum]